MNRMIWIFLLSANVAIAGVLTNSTSSNGTSKSSIEVPTQNSHENLQSNVTVEYFLPKTLKDWIDLMQGVSVIIASIIALFGINAWRKEFVGKRRMDLAEEVLTLFYQAKDVIRWMRHPASLPIESATRKPESTETPEQRGIKDLAYVFSKRYEQHSELFSRIHALRYRAMIQLCRDASVPFDELKSILDDLFTDLHMWVMLSGVDSSRYLFLFFLFCSK